MTLLRAVQAALSHEWQSVLRCALWLALGASIGLASSQACAEALRVTIIFVVFICLLGYSRACRASSAPSESLRAAVLKTLRAMSDIFDGRRGERIGGDA